MADAGVPEPADTTVHLLWINAGLNCDGDSVPLTAAMPPSIEDIALGALPGLPKVHFHGPLVATGTSRYPTPSKEGTTIATCDVALLYPFSGPSSWRPRTDIR